MFKKFLGIIDIIFMVVFWGIVLLSATTTAAVVVILIIGAISTVAVGTAMLM
jgi:hypothetical protein